MRRQLLSSALVSILTSLASAQGAHLGELVGLDTTAHDSFGDAVAVSGERALIGAPLNDESFVDDGAAYLFERQSGSWVQVAKLVPSDPVAGTLFGTAVALDGDRAVVSRVAAPLGVSSAIYTFERVGGAWVQTDKVQNPSPLYQFGVSLALEGTTLLVGATGSGSFQCGTVFVLVRTGGFWTFETSLPAPSCGFSTSSAQYGVSVALSGDRALVGKNHYLGKGGGGAVAYMFQRHAGTWSFVEELGTEAGSEITVALDGDAALLGYPLASSGDGRLELYRYTGPTFGFEWEDFVNGDSEGELGRAVALEGARALAGEPKAPDLGTDAGSVHAFTVGTEFGELHFLSQTKLYPPALAPDDHYGFAVAISGDLLLGGAPGDDGAGIEGGAAHVHSAQTFDASPVSISVSAGGSQVLALGAGPTRGGELFVILGTLAGTVPGQTFSGTLVPLNPGAYFTYTASHPGQAPLVGGLGVLDPLGYEDASFVLPAGSNPALIGLTAHHAFVLVNLGTLAVTFASNPEPVTFLP